MTKKTRQSHFRARLEEMVAGIREDILSGRISNGQFLPSELELAELYQLSKYSVRKALDTLVEEGFVQKIPRIGNKAIHPNHVPTATVRFGYYPSMLDQANLEALIAQFHQLYPHIRIESIPVPFKFSELNLMKHYLDAGLIDVAMFNQQSFSELVGPNGSLAALEVLQSPEGMYPFLLSAFEHQHKLRALPFVFSPVILCYNKEHFRTYDLPEPDSSWTWYDLLDIAKQITNEKEHIGFYYHAPSENRWPIFLLQSLSLLQSNRERQSIIRDNTREQQDVQKQANAVAQSEVIEGNQLKEAIRLTKDLIAEQGVASFLSQNDVEAEALFAQGKISMVMTTYFGLNFFKSAPFPFDIAPLPAIEESRTLNLVVGLAVSSKAADKEAAKTLVQHFVSFEAQSLIRQHTYSIPAIKKAAELPRNEVEDNKLTNLGPERFHLYREIIPSFHLHSSLGLSSEALAEIRNELRLYWSQVTTLEACCKQILRIMYDY